MLTAYGNGECVKFISILCDVCWRVNQLLRLKHPKRHLIKLG